MKELQANGEETQVARVFTNFLKSCGMYKPTGQRIAIWKIVIMNIYFQIITVGMVGFVYYYLKENEVIEFVYLCDAIAGLASILLSFSVQVSSLYPANGLDELLRDMGRLEGEELPEGYAEANRKMNHYATLFYRFIFCASGVLWLVLLFTKCEEDADSLCGLMISARLPYVDVSHPPARQIFMTLQMCTAIHNGFLTCTIAAVFATISNCLVVMLVKLQDMFLVVPKLKTRQERKVQVGKCVRYHHKILEFRNRCAKCSSNGFFFLMFFAAINISLNSFALIVLGTSFQLLLHLGVYLLVTTLNCYVGENLISASEDLLFVVYESIPFDGDKATADELCFIIMCSSRGIFIPAGKLGKVGHVRLHELMSTSYTILTMLLNTR